MPICRKNGLAYRSREIVGESTLVNALRNEHVLMDRFLFTLYRMSKQFERDEVLSTDAFDRFVDRALQFLWIELMGGHKKKEDALMLVIEREGLAKTDGVLAGVVTEHENLQRFLRVLSNAVEMYRQNGQRFGITHLTRNAPRYGRQLSEHMCEEENNLFPLAEMLPFDVQSALLEQFRAIDVQAHASVPEDALGLLRELEQERRKMRTRH